MPEVQRLLKNAEVAGRPDPLFPNSRDHEIRAAEIREKAKQLQTRLDQGVELGETRFTEVMKEFAATTDRLVEAGYLTIAVDLRDGLQTFAALQMPKRPDAMPNFRLGPGGDGEALGGGGRLGGQSADGSEGVAFCTPRRPRCRKVCRPRRGARN
jgi:hypothetical protein